MTKNPVCSDFGCCLGNSVCTSYTLIIRTDHTPRARAVGWWDKKKILKQALMNQNPFVYRLIKKQQNCPASLCC